MPINPPRGGVIYLNTSCARQNRRHKVFLVSVSFIHLCHSKNDPTDRTNCSNAFLLTCMHGWCPSSSIKQKFEIYICSIKTNLYSSLNTLWATYYHNNNWRDLKFSCINFLCFLNTLLEIKRKLCHLCPLIILRSVPSRPLLLIIDVINPPPPPLPPHKIK